ncbi:hypothetical protein [Williamsia soli]|uniref:hypothetical protein n=1 Tax=Williamsia soli TaxID=364929 RepID=UPI001A9E2564|nr:hypothetical protein [Williamsia soli]
MSRLTNCRAIGAGIVAAAGAALVLGAGPGAAVPDTGSAGAGTADLSLAISSGFDTCYLAITNNGPGTAHNVIAVPSSLAALVAGGPPELLGTVPAGQSRTAYFNGCGFIHGTPLTYSVFSTTADPNLSNNTVTY